MCSPMQSGRFSKPGQHFVSPFRDYIAMLIQLQAGVLLGMSDGKSEEQFLLWFDLYDLCIESILFTNCVSHFFNQ